MISCIVYKVSNLIAFNIFYSSEVTHFLRFYNIYEKSVIIDNLILLFIKVMELLHH